ncbi:MAG: cytidylate kinase [Candidatus Saccharibacteria bacterium]|nr:cytidylate kinase [Candidatus Saccharibacteria bacterium]
MPIAPTGRKHIITIAGMPASGKSTTARLLAEGLNYRHYSTGALFREIASSNQMDVLHANLDAEKNAAIDFQVDEHQKKLGETQTNFVIDGRLAWHFIPQSFKVYLGLDTAVGARRVLADMDEARRQREDVPKDPAEYAKLLDARLESESRRYRKLYGVDGHDPHNFDLFLDTSDRTPEQIKEVIITEYRNWMTTGTH